MSEALMILAVLPQGWGHSPPPQRNKGQNTQAQRFQWQGGGGRVRTQRGEDLRTTTTTRAEGTVGLCASDWNQSILTLVLVLPSGNHSSRGIIPHSPAP